MWPEIIKQKYKRSKPPTIRDTIDNLNKLLTFLQDTVEKLPSISALDLQNVERRIYNMRQVFSVMTENLPGSGTPADGGMKVLRDLFFELHYSTPEKDRGDTADFRNNLSLIAFIANSGLDRQLAFDFRRYDPTMLDQFWGGLVSLASAPTAPLLAKELLVDDKNHDLIWNLSKGLYPMMGNPLPASGPRLDALRTKQSMYYGLATIQQMHLISPVVQALTEALPGNTDYLAQHADLAVTGLSAVPTSRFCRALYSDASGPGKQAVTDVLTSALTEPQLASSGVALVALSEAIQTLARLSRISAIVGARLPRAKNIKLFSSVTPGAIF